MPEYIYGPLDRELVVDVLRFTDGTWDPFDMASEQLRNFIERSVETRPDIWGDRLDEVAEKYAPGVWSRWQEEDASAVRVRDAERQALVWKGLTIPAGSEVRMSYGGRFHHANVQ